MYKGNMKDFVNKVSEHLRRQYRCSIILGQYPDTGYFVAFFSDGQGSAVGYKVFDADNFEQQIYDFVNSELEDVDYVQGQHDELSKQSDGVSGEEISGSDG